MPYIKNIKCYWDLISRDRIVDKFLPLLPARAKYIFLIDDFDLKTVPDFDEKLRILNWNDKIIYSIRCTTLQQLNILL